MNLAFNTLISAYFYGFEITILKYVIITFFISMDKIFLRYNAAMDCVQNPATLRNRVRKILFLFTTKLIFCILYLLAMEQLLRSVTYNPNYGKQPMTHEIRSMFYFLIAAIL